MMNPNIVDFLDERGIPYAAGAVSGRIDEIKKAIATSRRLAAEESWDGQRSYQIYHDGFVDGLEKALIILGIGIEKE